MSRRLPAPVAGEEEVWVREHLSDLVDGEVRRSTAFRGGQSAAEAALAAFDVTGYAAKRNEVYPTGRRGASRLSPFVRHGLITLPRLWQAVAAGPPRDVAKFRDELLWQEYARHLYARTSGSAASLRYDVPARGASPSPDWATGMACLGLVMGELERDGWLVNQSRMWFASHWSVRHGLGWRNGEDLFFAHLLDGSRAANRLGWQWTVGAGTGRAYGFARAQVERRAPGLCARCALHDACPVQHYADDPVLSPRATPAGLLADPDPEATGGPREAVRRSAVSCVWLTAESLGDDDPALAAHPELPAVFVFDEALLARLRLTGKRLVFLTECLADLAERRVVQVWRGDPVEVMGGAGVAATYAPVPGGDGAAGSSSSARYTRGPGSYSRTAVRPGPSPPGAKPQVSVSGGRPPGEPRVSPSRSASSRSGYELGVRIQRAGWTIVGVRMLFADQLGPHFTHDVPADAPVLLVESRGAFARRRVHRQKAHLLLSALRHLAAELGDRAIHVSGASYGEALRAAGVDPSTVTVVDPTSYAARRWVREQGMTVLPARGFTMAENDFQEWLGTRRPVLEDFYRHQRRRLDLLVHPDGEPESGRWNFDADNRLPPPKGARTLGLPHPWAPTEDAIDDAVRRDLDAWRDEGITFVGIDAPRTFAATRAEAQNALDDFVRHRLAQFGPYEDAVLQADWAMAHSLLSVPLNLGLLDPLEVVDAAITAYRAGHVPLQSVEAVIRQVIGWREWAWQLYWALGEDYADGNALAARTPVPDWFADLDADAVQAACLRSALAEVRDRGWSHHIVRLMVLGNWALQRGYDPKSTAAWFRDSFVDGFDWVMVTNVVGMALFADGGRMATKPYAAGGAYLNRMTDHCRGCHYTPTTRVGPKACPFTAGYWAFLDHNSDALRRNHRLAQPYAGLARLADRKQLLAEQSARGDDPP